MERASDRWDGDAWRRPLGPTPSEPMGWDGAQFYTGPTELQGVPCRGCKNVSPVLTQDHSEVCRDPSADQRTGVTGLLSHEWVTGKADTYRISGGCRTFLETSVQPSGDKRHAKGHERKLPDLRSHLDTPLQTWIWIPLTQKPPTESPPYTKLPKGVGVVVEWGSY